MSAPHRVYFVPGMFGFAKLAGYDYFHHLRRALEHRYRLAQVPVIFEDVPAPPTSSLRYRSRVLATTVARSLSRDDGPIHFIGHSTGGLDVRLVLSPSANLGLPAEALSFRSRVESAVTMNTPHYGTPLASYFATVSGTRLLYALSLLTVVSLSLGEPSLAIFSKLLAGFGSLDNLFGGDLKLVSRITDSILRFVDKDGRQEIHEFLSQVRVDQGGVIQIMPEAMDLFNAATENHEGARYACVISAAPPPRSLRAARRIRSPYAALTAALYSTLYQFASQRPKVYPYARLTSRQLDLVRAGIEHPVDESSNDGIVPTLSMLWGELLWAGEADHLDVIGHFHDEIEPTDHTDWVTSGSRFTRQRFSALVDAIARFQLEGPRRAR
jgi:triacylglycerol esterase/lipase EstA (alpha/beta hydrolase family)